MYRLPKEARLALASHLVTDILLKDDLTALTHIDLQGLSFEMDPAGVE